MSQVFHAKKGGAVSGTAKFREETSKKQRAEATLHLLSRKLSRRAQADSFCAATSIMELWRGSN
jgi:hypothetical protein